MKKGAILDKEILEIVDVTIVVVINISVAEATFI